MTRDAMSYLTGRLTGGDRPAAVGEKFAPDGRILPWGGNTFICHIPSGIAHDVLTAVQARLQEGPLAAAFAFLPPSSFHMTVFEGANDRRRGDDSWPAGVDPDAPMAAVTDRFLAAVRPLSLPRSVAIRPTALFGGFSVSVAGASAADEAQLRAAREALSLATGIRRQDFANYGFHITLGYLLRWLTEAEAAEVIALSDRLHADLAAALPRIELGPVEFCTFADMGAFPQVAVLGSGG